MSKGKSREYHAGHVDTITTTLHSQRSGIPYRVSEDLCIMGGEEIRVHEGDTIEVIYCDSKEWWTAILADDNVLINSTLLQPLSGSMGSNLSIVEISDKEPISVSGLGRNLKTLVPLRPTGKFTGLEPPSPLATPALLAEDVHREIDDSVELLSPVKDGIRLLPPQVRALSDVNATNPGELSYKKGDIIDVELRSTADQWQGRLGSHTGTFRLDGSLEPVIKERVRAVWDYSPSMQGDLKFKAGDIIEVCGTSNTSNWWFHGWMPSRGFGMFPYNFVESLDDEFSDTDDEEGDASPPSPIGKSSMRFRVLSDISLTKPGDLLLKRGDIIDLIQRQTDDKWLGRVNLQTGTFPLNNCVEPIMTDRVKALFSYETSNPEELSFAVDDCITVVSRYDESTMWWYGKLKGRFGLFPLNYVELIPDARYSTNESDDWVEIKSPQTLRALHNFSSKDPDILSFDANDIIIVLDADTESDWWKGETDGRTGLFPRTYCEEILDLEDPISTKYISSKSSQNPLDSFNLTSQRATSNITRGPDSEVTNEPGVIIDASTLNPKETPISSRHDLAPLLTTLVTSPKLSSIQEANTPTAGSSNVFISTSPSQLTPTTPSNAPDIVRDTASSLPWSPCFARALCEFKGTNSEELSFLKGDLIEILAMSSTDWWSGKLRDQIGRMPANSLELINLNDHSQRAANALPLHAATVPTEMLNDNPVSPLGKPTSTPLPDISHQQSRRPSERKRGTDMETLLKAEWVRARHGWSSGKAGELVLDSGDLIRVLKRPYEHWWKGRLERTKEVGLFPANFIEAVSPPGPELARGSNNKISASQNDEAIIALRSNVKKLFSLLLAFDMQRDIADNAEIQNVFRTSCSLRRKVARLLVEKPDDADLKALDASFQEVKAHYEMLLQHSAKRALGKGKDISVARPGDMAMRSDAENPLRIPTSSGSGASAEAGIKPPFMDDQDQTTNSEHQRVFDQRKDSDLERRNTGDSIRAASLPRTPAPDSSALASMLSKRQSQGESGWNKRYSGRLSAIEADIKRAKKAYEQSIRSQEDAKPRRLPNTENPIRILRSVRGMITAKKGPTVQTVPDKKTIHLPRVEYIHNHIVYGNQ